MSTTAIVILVAVAVAAALVITQRKKKGKTNSKPTPGSWVPPVVADNPPTPPMQPVSQPVRPISQPEPHTYPPTVPSVDLRARRPDPEFSPVEPFGAYYGEGPFDPNGRYIDTQGRLHNP